MKVLLTGGGGFIGRHVLRLLKQKGIEVVTLGRTPLGSSDNHIAFDLLSGKDVYPVLKEIEATHLLHLAWYVEHGKYWDSHFNLRWVDATTRLVESFCAAGGRKVVAAGSCVEYNWAQGYCREDSNLLSRDSLYGVSKNATRELVMGLCDKLSIPCAWGRVFFTYGNGECPERLIPALIDVFRGLRAPFGINSDAYRDFLHVADVAAGFVTLLTGNSSGVYNISSGDPVRLSSIVFDLSGLLGGNPGLILDLTTERPGEPQFLIGDNLKLKSLGWQPELSLIQGLEHVLNGGQSPIF